MPDIPLLPPFVVGVKNASDARINPSTEDTLLLIKAKTDNIPALGQALTAGSVPVVLTAAQLSTLTPPAAIIGFATETTLASIKTALETLDNIVSGNEAQVDIVTQPARDRLTDNVGAALQTDVIMNDTTALTPKFAVINLSASGDIVALVASKKIRVLALTVIAAGTVNVTFRSGGSTAKTGVMPLIANTGFVLPFNPVGWFETVSGEKLDALLSASIDVDGFLTYIEV